MTGPLLKPLSVACPTCQAGVGMPCRAQPTFAERSPHDSRINLAALKTPSRSDRRRKVDH